MAIGMYDASGAAATSTTSSVSGVDHARDRRSGARADVRGGAGDGAGGRQPAEDRRHDVGDALRDELDVRVVPVAAHAIGDDGRHQRLDGAEHGDRQRRAQQRRNERDVELPG